MKSLIGIMLVFIVQYDAFSQQRALRPLNQQISTYSSVEMGKRYLKLGFSWIGSGNYDKAEYYLTKGLKIVRLHGDKYWEAVGNEFFGYLNLAQNNKTEALEWFYSAQNLYDRYGTLNNGEGSNSAIASLIESIKNDENTIFGKASNSQANSKNFDDLMQKYNQVVQERDDLKLALQNLKYDIAELKRKNSELQARLDDIAGRIGRESPNPNTGFGDFQPSPTGTSLTSNSSSGSDPWSNSNSGETDNFGKKLLILQAGAGNVFNFETKLKFGKFEIGGFIIDQKASIIYGAILSYEVYKGKNWDAPFDLTVGRSTDGIGPYIDGYACFRYFFLEHGGIYAKAGYNMAYVLDLVPSSYMNFSVGIVFTR